MKDSLAQVLWASSPRAIKTNRKKLQNVCYSRHFDNSFIHSFIFNIRYILVRVVNDPETIPGILGKRQGVSPSQGTMYTFTPRGNLRKSVYLCLLMACFGQREGTGETRRNSHWHRENVLNVNNDHYTVIVQLFRWILPQKHLLYSSAHLRWTVLIIV